MEVVHENILVRPKKLEKSRNGVLLPEDNQVNKREGTIVKYGDAIPEGVVKKFLENPQNPEILYKEYYDGSEVTIEGEEFIVMNYKDILIIL